MEKVKLPFGHQQGFRPPARVSAILAQNKCKITRLFFDVNKMLER